MDEYNGWNFILGIFIMNKPLNELKKNKNEFLSHSVTPDLGRRPEQKKFFEDLEYVKENSYAYRIGIFSFADIDYNNFKIKSLGGGDPMKIKPFPGVSKKIKKVMNSKRLSMYNHSAGDKEQRKEVVNYLNKIGIKEYLNDDGVKNVVNENNVIFTSSTSHAFSLLLKAILRPYDVVLFTAPTYGLFAYYPERIGGITKFIPLKSENNYLIDSKDLDLCINNINKQLELEYSQKLDYIPKVVAFLNINPHNPIGSVMSKKQKNILYNVAKICEKHGVFIIDDMVYKDIGYDINNQALPIATFPEYFNSTITLFGLSKSYGLAGLRAGVVVANEEIIAKIRDLIFHNMDSLSLVQSTALSYCFSQYGSKKYNKYFSKINLHYMTNLEILKYFVFGENNTREKNKIKRLAYKVISKVVGTGALDGFYQSKGVKFAGNVLPEAGFFAVLDFSAVKGLKYKNCIIENEDELLYFLFRESGIKFITGKSMGWPNKNQLIARITFSMKSEEFAKRLLLLNKALNMLY